LHETAAFGARAGGGINRLALGDDDKAARDWFKAATEALGCTVAVDEVGNMFARRPGKMAHLAPIAIGSHLDTQPTGGKFDGVLGVLAGLEVLRTLDRVGYVTNAPIEVVNWTNEEGTRFAPAMLASGVFAGVFPPEFAWSRTDRDGIRFEDELIRIGYKGAEKAGSRAFSGVFELHIEQGPVLEAADTMIGVVTGVQAARWFDVTITGKTGHTGATPMRLRADALIGAARVVQAIETIARYTGTEAVGSVGRLDVSPNSRNVIPGAVALSVDLRHPDDIVVAGMAEDFHAALERIGRELKLVVDTVPVWTAPAVTFAPELVAFVETGARLANCTYRRMVSGAGHDAAYLARVAPTAMIFVPCAGGVSHNVLEFTSREQCAAGAQVLLNAVLAFDDDLASRRFNGVTNPRAPLIVAPGPSDAKAQ
jgi:N-carbamoyl-L-amino-acid hydrolase